MKIRGQDAPFARMDRPFVLLAGAVLLLGLFYTLAFVLWVPYPGVDFNVAWQVLGFDNPCDSRPDWCAMRDQSLQVGDRLLAIGDLTYDKYAERPIYVPFWGYGPGDRVPIVYLRGGAVQQATWEMLGPTGDARFVRLVGVLIFLPFWLAGTAVLLFLRPRNTLWRVLIAFNYLTAVWIASGIPSVYRIGGSALVLRIATWMMIPVYLHLHLLAPRPLLINWHRYLLPLLYYLSGGMAVLQILLPGSSYWPNWALLLALVGSVGLLLFRLARREPAEIGPTLRLMLIGVGLTFELGLLLWVVPALATSSAAGRLAINITTIAIALLPFFYVYALYKRQMGTVEFRANRILSALAFFAIYITTFLFVFVLGTRWVYFSSSALAFVLFTSVAFVALGLVLRDPFQRLVDRLAYGTTHNPNDILRAFANQIPRALDRRSLVWLLAQEVLPSLLVRQWALYRISGDAVTLLHAQGVTPPTGPEADRPVRELVGQSLRYRPPDPDDRSAFAWVRLPISVEVGGRRIAAWLLGGRDPDDFYPKPDVDLLETLAGQVGVALENARLFENLQNRAAELEQAYNELQELDKRKDEFVQRISHELRTPLTVMRWYASLLLKGAMGELTAEQRTAVETIANRTEDMIGLANAAIAVQQDELQDLKREPVSLALLAQSALQVARAMAEKRHPDITYEFVLDAADDVPVVWGDRRWLGQVFDNLLDNAVKFSPEGGKIVVSIRPVRYPFNGPAADGTLHPGVQVSISDQGIGIPTDQIERIWERFFQVDGTIQRRFGGMGLGLSIVRAIIEAHGGAVWAESTVGGGSTFHFVLPIWEEPSSSPS
ncbi:MAG: sensor histidine kinase [Anaerolineae bacterium]